MFLAVPGSYLLAQGKAKTVNVTFTTIDVPGAGYTIIWGVNNLGDMVGSYGQDTAQDAHGFLYSSTFTYFDYPGQSVTVPRGINDSNLIVGYAGSGVLSFLYDGTTFTSFHDGNDSATYSNGLNNGGDVVGAAGSLDATWGFEMRNGQYRTLQVPGSYVYVHGGGHQQLRDGCGLDRWRDLRWFPLPKC